MKLKSIVDLRDHALRTLEKLSAGKIEVDEAATTAKLCETVISGVKTEMAYANMLGREPNIAFLGTPYSKQNTKELKG